MRPVPNRHLARAALLLALLIPAFAHAAGVTRFHGSVTDVGDPERTGTGGVEYRVRGEFDHAIPIDLRTSTVTFFSLLAEVGPGGAGELLTNADDAPLVPIVVRSRPRYGTRRVALYETRRFRPQFRMTLRNINGHFEFFLRIDRALASRVPHLCTGDPPGQTTAMLHRFVIDDGVHPPIDVSTVQLWECSNLEGFQMKARNSSTSTTIAPPPRTTTTVAPPRTTTTVPPPRTTTTAPPPRTTTTAPPPRTTTTVITPRPTTTVAPPRPTTTVPRPQTTTTLPAPVPGNAPPTASLRIEALSRQSGIADRVELDGTESADRDGVIVSYRFDSGDGRVQEGPQPKAVFLYAPGDYRATLTVFDNRGSSGSTSRGFSEK